MATRPYHAVDNKFTETGASRARRSCANTPVGKNRDHKNLAYFTQFVARLRAKTTVHRTNRLDRNTVARHPYNALRDRDSGSNLTKLYLHIRLNFGTILNGRSGFSPD